MTGADAWQALDHELAAWAAAGRTAEIWWRDDDAAAPSPALDRLLALAARTGAPLCLAVIPAEAPAALAAAVERHGAETAVLQHGASHRNNAGPDAKKCELVDPAARPDLPQALAQGRESLAALFGARFRAVMVPPWNRIAERLAAALPALGFTGLSTYKARNTAHPAAGLYQANCHVDILQWRPQRQFLGTQEAVGLLAGHLAAKRLGSADPGEPTGILSHHQVHDEAAWDFLAALLQHLARHPAARLLPADRVFGAAPQPAQRKQRS